MYYEIYCTLVVVLDTRYPGSIKLQLNGMHCSRHEEGRLQEYISFCYALIYVERLKELITLVFE